MTFKTSTLRPGLLVSMKTSVTGNVRYSKETIESDHALPTGERKASWNTERLISDPAEHEAATKARGRACTIVRAICSHTAFGYLCPEDAGDALEKAIAAARAEVDAFNAGAKITRITFYVIAGRIAPDDVEAVRAINSEVRDLLAEMETGIKNLDVKVVRDAASRAKQLGAMLSPDAAARVQIAIDAARGLATRIKAAGEQAAQEVDAATVRRITEARTAFLDLEEAGAIATPAAEARAVDFASAPVGKIAVTSPAMDL